jgi:hypothetical protein
MKEEENARAAKREQPAETELEVACEPLSTEG